MLSFVRAAAQRAWTGARVAFSDGQGIYLVTLLLLGAAALFLHRAMTPEWKYHDALTHLLRSEQEPFRGETHQVLSAGLSFDSIFVGSSDPTSSACEHKGLLSSLDSIAERFTSELEAVSDADQPVLDELFDLFAIEPGIPKGAGSGSDGLHECNEDACPTKTLDLGYSLTDQRAEPGKPMKMTLIVPSTVAASLRRLPEFYSHLITSHVLGDDEKIQTLLKSISSLRAAYFIDLLGDLRYVPLWQPRGMPAHRTFAGASYFYETLSRRPRCPNHKLRYATRPYLDLAGGGVVQTLCYGITHGKTKRWSSGRYVLTSRLAKTVCRARCGKPPICSISTSFDSTARTSLHVKTWDRPIHALPS
jgi:hypothetical protein